jgi:hypothetical protein
MTYIEHNHIDIIVLASSEVDRGFKHRSGQTKY